MGFTCAFETLLCSFNCGRPPNNTKTHYDKMAESSTHFTLHETMTTNQSRAVTDDSLQGKQLSSRPSGLSRNAPSQQQQQIAAANQYLVNENYDKSEKTLNSRATGQSKKNGGQTTSQPQQPPDSRTVSANFNSGVITKATVEQSAQFNTTNKCNQQKSTGAIPKQAQQQKSLKSSSISQSQQNTVTQNTSHHYYKPSTNHLDEIVSLPLDDLNLNSNSKQQKVSSKTN